MTPNEDDLEGLPDKEFKRVTIFTQFIEDTNILQENKNIEIMNETRMPIQNAKKCIQQRNRLSEENPSKMMLKMKIFNESNKM